MRHSLDLTLWLLLAPSRAACLILPGKYSTKVECSQ